MDKHSFVYLRELDDSGVYQNVVRCTRCGKKSTIKAVYYIKNEECKGYDGGGWKQFTGGPPDSNGWHS